MRRDFPQGGTFGGLVRFDLRQSPQGAADRWLLGTVCLANVAAMPDDLPDLRASHADRDRVVDALRVAGGDGRLSAEELDTRLESALSARTRGELAEFTATRKSSSRGRDVAPGALNSVSATVQNMASTSGSDRTTVIPGTTLTSAWPRTICTALRPTAAPAAQKAALSSTNRAASAVTPSASSACR